MNDATRLAVVVLSCGDLGIAVANALHALPAVRRVSLFNAPYRKPRRGFRGKVRHVYRTQGLPGFISVAAAKARSLLGRSRQEEQSPARPTLAHGVERFEFRAFEAPECIEAIRAQAPDLGVIAGTYILPETVFAIPRLGSINLHTGKVPEYRGAAPAFWELFNGEREVGISIHQVVPALDAGAVLLQETFPLDPAPSGDPLAYIDAYRREVLEPNGIRMVAEAVTRLADGSAEPRPQKGGASRTYRTPDYAAIRALRARVAARRSAAPRART